MKLLKKSLIAPTIAFVLSINLLAQDPYTVETSTLKEALEIISEKSKLSYIANESLLQNKKAPSIKNVEGLEETLKILLKGSGLEAVIKHNTILIKKKTISSDSDSSSLEDVEVIASSSNITEGSDSYTIESMSTATKMNLSLRDTPQSVTVMTNQNMSDKNLSSLIDVTNNIVGLNILTEDSERFNISSRGFYVDYYQIDGMVTHLSDETQQDTIMYDRVEVVRGANGLVSGAGNPAASINLIRKHANSKEFEGSFNIKAGSWNTYRADLDVSSSLNEDGSIRGRAIISHEDKESFRDYYKKKRDVFYGVLDIDMGDHSTVSLGASYQKDDAKGATWGGIPAFFSNGVQTNFDSSTSFTPKWATMPTTTKTLFANFKHTFSNDVKFNANYSYLDAQTDPIMALYSYYSGLLANQTTGLGANIYPWMAHVTNKTHTFDMNTVIPLEISNREHEIITGLSYNNKKYYSLNTKPSNNTSVANIYNWNPNIAKFISDDNPYVTYDDDVTEISLYLAGNIALSDDLKLIVGSRLTNWDVATGKTKWLEAVNIKHKNIITPYLGLTYKFNENHSVYASYSDIFNPQDKLDKGGKKIDPAEGKNYEIGIKGEYFDKSLTSSLSLFRIEQNNLAQEDGSNVVPGTTNQAYVTADGVISKGIEFEVLGKVTKNLHASFAISHFEAKDNKGKNINSIVPRTDAMISSKYKINKLTLGATAKWKSDISHNVSSLQEGNVFTMDTLMKYQFSKDIVAQLNIDNIFNKKYFIHFPYGTQYVYGDPRKITLSLNYKF